MKTSVLMIAYNQEAYIREALESVLAQQTNFDFEVVIGEDCSKDNTRSIIQSYETANPGKIRGLYRPQNLGMIENFIQTYRACRGEYIAVLEGDDYWIDPLKLQKQIDFFERHPNYWICFHDTLSRTNTADLDAMPHLCHPEQKKVSHFLELLAENFIQTCSVMWRNLGNNVRFPEGLHQLKVGDWPVHLMHAQRGPIGYIPEAMAVYRVSPNGVWSQLDLETRFEAILEVYKVVDAYFEYEYTRFIEQLIYYESAYRNTYAEAIRLQPKEKQLVEVLVERDHLRNERDHLRNDLKAHQEALQHLLASRGVRIGKKLCQLANLPSRLVRALKSRARFKRSIH